MGWDPYPVSPFPSKGKLILRLLSNWNKENDIGWVITAYPESGPDERYSSKQHQALQLLSGCVCIYLPMVLSSSPAVTVSLASQPGLETADHGSPSMVAPVLCLQV